MVATCDRDLRRRLRKVGIALEGLGDRKGRSIKCYTVAMRDRDLRCRLRKVEDETAAAAGTV